MQWSRTCGRVRNGGSFHSGPLIGSVSVNRLQMDRAVLPSMTPTRFANLNNKTSEIALEKRDESEPSTLSGCSLDSLIIQSLSLARLSPGVPKKEHREKTTRSKYVFGVSGGALQDSPLWEGPATRGGSAVLTRRPVMGRLAGLR